jgi:hypothetical protein
MSHAKNVETYSRLVEFCTGYGGNYNPGQQNLKLNAMRALLEKAQSSLQDVSLKRLDYKRVTNEREIAFTDLSKLATRIVLYLSTSGVPDQTVDDARFYSRLIGGRLARRREPIPSDEADEKTLTARSLTQRSYVALKDHFTQLVELIKKEAAYKPNEEDLQIASLEAKIDELNATTAKVHKAKAEWSNALIYRNRLIYKGRESLINHGATVKRYVRSVFGNTSAQSVQMAEVSFTKRKVK